MAADRARKVRAFARTLEDRFGGRFDAEYDTGAKWRLDWVDGPAGDTVRALADPADLAGADLRLWRRHSLKAIAVTSIRMAAAGKLGRYDGGRHPVDLAEWEAREVDFPDRGADPLQDTLASLLVAAAKTTSEKAWAEYHATHTPGSYRLGDYVPLDVENTVVDLVRTRGLGWLIEQAIADGAHLPPLAVLSARYADRAEPTGSLAWRDRGQPLPLHTAVTLALADAENLPAPAAAALLALLPDLRAEWARTEAAILTKTESTDGQPTTDPDHGKDR